jgi:FHS family L-fucose permease-like MFS transporter
MTGTAKSPLMPMAIIGGMFFIFGFVTWLNGPLITFVKLAFRLDDVSAFLVPMAFYMSYFFLSLPAAAILRRTGMKKGMALALLVMAVGAALFGQCVGIRVFPGALTALFVIGAGLSILQTASNPYISILGPIDSAAQRIAFMGICNKLAGACAPLVFSALIMSGISGLADQVAAAGPAGREGLLAAFAHKIYVPYLVMAGLLAVLAVAVALSPLPEITDRSNADDAPKGSLFGHPNLWLGFICLFLYVGVEVMAGDAIGTYGRGFGLPLDQTKYFTSGTLVAMLLGYVVGLVVIPRFVSQARYLAFSAVLGVLLAIAAYLTRGCQRRLRRRPGLRQRHDVAGHLPARHQGAGPSHRNRLGYPRHGDSRRRGGAAIVRLAEGNARFPNGLLRADGPVLPVHPVFRAVRRTSGWTERVRL